MRGKNDFHEETASILLDIDLPRAQMPLHKKRLGSALAQYTRLNQKTKIPLFREALQLLHFFCRKYGAYSLAAASVFLLLALRSILPLTGPAFAHIVLEVNPAVRLTIDSRGNVVEFEPLDETARLIFADTDFRSSRAQNTIGKIIDKLHGHAALEKENRVLLVISPAEGQENDNLSKALGEAELAVNRRLARLDSQAQVRSFTMPPAAFVAARQAGLTPSQYAGLLDYGLTPAALTALFKYGEENEPDRDYFIGHFEEIAENLTEVLDKEVPEEEAVSVVKEVLSQRRGTVGLRRVVRRLNQLLDEDMTPKEALARIRGEIRNQADDLDDPDDGSESDDEGQDQAPQDEETETYLRERQIEQQEKRTERRRQRIERRRQQNESPELRDRETTYTESEESFNSEKQEESRDFPDIITPEENE